MDFFQAMEPMQDYSFVVGQEFPDVKAFRKAIKEVAIARHFELRIIKSDLIRYIAKCAAEGCPWHIRAVKLPNSPTFTIRSLEPKHTCGQNAQDGHHQASVDWIVSFIEERLRDDINYKPKDILNDIQKQYGITIPYKQAWRAKERALATIYGSSEEGYCVLPAYCDEIKRINPGTVAEVFTSGVDNRFQNLFISFYASIHGFLNGCLPVVALGGIQLKSKYLGTLMAATSFDADGGLFPLAFGVVDVENEDTWMWFLTQIYKALEKNTDNIPQLAFLSDGTKSISVAVKVKFQNSCHAICVSHLSESLGKELKNSRLIHLVWKAAEATTFVAFKEKMTEIEEISSEAAKWFEQFPPSSWALVYFQGKRYGHFSSNIDEFNKWILESRELPIIQVIGRIHNKLITIFQERCSKTDSWSSILVPSAQKRMEEALFRASTYQVLRSDEVEFEVLSLDRSDIVNIGSRSCSCCDWQVYGIPCSHAVAALLSCKKDVYAFTDVHFSVDNYLNAYSQDMLLIPDKIDWKKSVEAFVAVGGSRVVRPPKIRRPPGRPEKKRVCVDCDKHTVRCSRCNQTGHYKTTCKAEIL